MTWQVVAEKLLFWCLGALVSGGVAYITLGRQVAFVRGQLSQLLEAWKDFTRVRDSHAELAEDYHLHKHLPADQAHPTDPPYPTSLHG